MPAPDLPDISASWLEVQRGGTLNELRSSKGPISKLKETNRKKIAISKRF